MPSTQTDIRSFTPGTTGWTESDLDDPEIEKLWDAGRYEIVQGVLTSMAPAYYIGGKALQKLINRIVQHIGDDVGSFATEVEIVMDEDRVVRADAVFMTPVEEKRQHRAAILEGRKNPERTRVLVPPTLIIECVSPGHEQHDRKIKRRWYAEFGVKNYWILDPFKHSLDCLVRRDRGYAEDVSGTNKAELTPALFPGLRLPLARIFTT